MPDIDTPSSAEIAHLMQSESNGEGNVMSPGATAAMPPEGAVSFSESGDPNPPIPVSDPEAPAPAPAAGDDDPPASEEPSEATETDTPTDTDEETASAVAEAVADAATSPDKVAELLSDPAFMELVGGKEGLATLLQDARKAIEPYGDLTKYQDLVRAQTAQQEQAAAAARQKAIDEALGAKIADRAKSIAETQLRAEWEAEFRDPDEDPDTFNRVLALRSQSTLYQAAQEVGADYNERTSGVTALLSADKFGDAMPVIVEEVAMLERDSSGNILKPSEALAVAARYAEITHAHTQAKIAPFRVIAMQAEAKAAKVQSDFDAHKASEETRWQTRAAQLRAEIAAELAAGKELATGVPATANSANNDAPARGKSFIETHFPSVDDVTRTLFPKRKAT